MKRILIFLFVSLMFMSCNKNTSNETFKQEKDSIEYLNDIILSLNDSIEVLHDSIMIIKKSDIEKVEIVKFNDFKARELYVKNCKFCHGDKGEGDGIKTKIDTTICPHDLALEDKPDQDVYFLILNGSDNMPSQSSKLVEKDIWLLVLYVKKLKK